MDLIAGKKCYYRGSYVPEGERFSAPRQYARPLLAMKRAKPAPQIVQRAKRTYSTRAMPREATETVVMEPDFPQRADVVFSDAPDELVASSVKLSPLKPNAEDLKALRARYIEVLGKRPFPGWDADKLRAKIADEGKA